MKPLVVLDGNSETITIILGFGVNLAIIRIQLFIGRRKNHNGSWFGIDFYVNSNLNMSFLLLIEESIVWQFVFRRYKYTFILRHCEIQSVAAIRGIDKRGETKLFRCFLNDFIFIWFFEIVLSWLIVQSFKDEHLCCWIATSLTLLTMTE
jgi:hypothetical protein